jgi:hypothetical protein
MASTSIVISGEAGGLHLLERGVVLERSAFDMVW